MFAYTIEIYEKEEWILHPSWTRPTKDAETLDESLDFGEIVLFNVQRREPYKPFTPLRIGIYEMSEDLNVNSMSISEREAYRVDFIYRYVSNPRVKQTSFAYQGGEDRYSHTINTIEFSKKLERDICDPLKFSNDLGRMYGDYSQPIEITTFYYSSGAGWLGEDFYINHDTLNSIRNTKQPKEALTWFTFPSFRKIFNLQPSYMQGYSFWVHVIDENGVFNVIHNYSDWFDEDYVDSAGQKGYPHFKVTDFEDKDFSTTLHPGTYKAFYSYSPTHDRISLGYNVIPRPDMEVRVEFSFEVYSNKQRTTKWNLASVVNRILTVCPTRRDGIEKQKYALDPEMEKKFSQIDAPEFSIPRCTLWEALQQVGGYAHYIPRLTYPNIVTFDELGGDTEYVPPDYLRCAAYESDYDIDETCDAIDSSVENFLSTKDLGQGAIVDPCNGGFKSVRCDENNFMLTNDNALFLAEQKFYRILKVEIAKADSHGGWQYIGDITRYIFEEAEYKTLSSYGGYYPKSRSYALKYVRGDNKITEFDFKPETRTYIGELANKPAIKNIIERCGSTCPTLYNELGFRVTYIPHTTARVRQYKSHSESDTIGQNVLIYNQTANTVESSSYGENLKGTVARIGNLTEKETYYFRHYADIPKIGWLWDDRYIVKIEKAHQKEWIKATVTLTKDFNALAQYLGVHTEYRLYEVSEIQSIDRQINYGERVTIGNEIPVKADAGITKKGIALFKKTISGHDGVTPINNAIITPMNNAKRALQNIMLTCASTGFGNSVAFSWRFQDNYGAGYKSSYSTLFGSQFKRIQEIVPYGDIQGKAKYLSVKLFNDLPFNFSVSTAHDLPKVSTAITQDAIFDFSKYPFDIDKDGSECIGLTSQLHFVANRKSIVIGPGMSQLNTLVTPSKLKTEILFLDKRLNVFHPIFSSAIAGNNNFYTVDTVAGFILHITNVPTWAKSWALVGVQTSEEGLTTVRQLIIGENISGPTQPVYFTFNSNKEE